MRSYGTTDAATVTDLRAVADLLDGLPTLCRDRRRMLGIGLHVAAAEMDMSGSTLNRFETGQRGAYVETVSKVLRWLDERGETL